MSLSPTPAILDAQLTALLEPIRSHRGRILVLTGAGISAESGIPTFRGHDGYWVVGSRNYMPEEMATHAMFERHPEQVWRWYLMRFGICADAIPNAAHRAIVQLEQGWADGFTLVTQNIDGLHRRAGSSEARTFCIHGDSAYVRCAQECGAGLLELPKIPPESIGPELTPKQREVLSCPRCGGWLRPHVLWFDECYNEHYYRADSAIQAALAAELLIVVGTSGATNLPMQIGMLCLRQGTTVVDVNPEPNPFSAIAERAERGHSVVATACDALPQIVSFLLKPSC